MNRRELLAASLCMPLAALAVPVRGAPLRGDAPEFDAETVARMARELAARPWRASATPLPSWLDGLGYDAWRDIRFDPDRALWRGDDRGFTAQFFHRGFLFREPVALHEVVGGRARPIGYTPGLFDFGANEVPAAAEGASGLGFAGFRLHAPLNRPEYLDEVCVFLGASYFRAVARGQVYGLSARGLALRSGDPGGEEFPRFVAVWLERPVEHAGRIVVHALLDSPSAAGAYRFEVTPGDPTVMDVSARIHPRVPLDQAGIAPLTSMFQFDASDRGGFDDYRAAVHDSDGLALLTAAGETVWRPLSNPPVLRHSRHAGDGLRGFGLLQRKRDFSDFGDAEANYHRRPSAWVEPRGDWGPGHVHLLEIPTGDEYMDNIVASWRPQAPLEPGREHRFDYRLHWGGHPDWNPRLARVARTATGAVEGGGRRFVIDLRGLPLPCTDAVEPEVSASAGALRHVTVHPLPDAAGCRLAFELHPGDAPEVELRARLLDPQHKPLTETWLYQWTR